MKYTYWQVQTADGFKWRFSTLETAIEFAASENGSQPQRKEVNL
jgi:hypothetical protein